MAMATAARQVSTMDRRMIIVDFSVHKRYSVAIVYLEGILRIACMYCLKYLVFYYNSIQLNTKTRTQCLVYI